MKTVSPATTGLSVSVLNYDDRLLLANTSGSEVLVLDYKHRIRAKHRFYSQDLINNLFSHPYTKIEFIQSDLGVSRGAVGRRPESRGARRAVSALRSRR